MVVLAATLARAQPTPDSAGDPIADLIAQAAPADAVPARQTIAQPLTASEQALFAQALNAARKADISGARNAIAALNHPVAKKLAMWALVDANGESLSFSEVEQARRTMREWPRATRRHAHAERQLAVSGFTPAQTIAWFEGRDPQTAYGALALASAYRANAQADAAANLVRLWWRDKSFEIDVQRGMLARFADVLTVDDHVRRADTLLYGSQGPAAREMIALLPLDQQPLAQARIALRADAKDANDKFGTLTPEQATSPGVAFERAAYLRRRGLETAAIGQLDYFPRMLATGEQADRIWHERIRLTHFAIKNGDWAGAYKASANTGLTVGSDAADAEFYAGWIALTRLKDAPAAARHFAALGGIATSAVTKGRAAFWQGRAAEAMGDATAAQTFYRRGAEHQMTFYGQLSAEKIGLPMMLPNDPLITAADHARFESRDVVQAARLLWDQGQKNLFQVFVLHIDDQVPDTNEAALLVDLIRGYGDQDTSMKAVRAAAQRGLVLGDRGYPYRTPPEVADGAELALTMAITRQESGFDPLVRSPVGARGMMQLMPDTARITARKVGVDYAPNMLDEPEYNMRLGRAYLGGLVSRFSGSYVMAIAGYNAGPGRPAQWVSFCGDPRGGQADPLDFIECIPFGETRNYVMRVMEQMQVYRAKLNGGTAPVTLAGDLRRGSYGYPSLPAVDASEP
jgi:soluble lytic murein transglycosylase